jgi:DNA-binding transcriptional ArsR family regulator
VAAPLRIIDSIAGARAALHPLRLRILEALEEGASAREVGAKVGLPRQTVNYHLQQLARQGLVEPEERGRVGARIDRVYRLAARSYVIAASALKNMAADPSRIADKFSSAYLAAVAARTIKDLGRLRPKAEEHGKRLPTLTLESEVRFATPADQLAFANALSAAFAELVRRYHDDQAPGGRTFRVFAAGYPAVPDEEPAREETA